MLCSDTIRVVPGADDGFAAAFRLDINSIRERGRGPPPFCLGGWGSREGTQPFRRNGRAVRLFTPTFRFFGISSIGLPLFGFCVAKKYIVTFGSFFRFTSCGE